MKNRIFLLLGIIFILSLLLLFGLCSCEGDAPDSESTGNLPSTTDTSMPDLDDIFSFPEGGIELPIDEFE